MLYSHYIYHALSQVKTNVDPSPVSVVSISLLDLGSLNDLVLTYLLVRYEVFNPFFQKLLEIKTMLLQSFQPLYSTLNCALIWESKSTR